METELQELEIEQYQANDHTHDHQENHLHSRTSIQPSISPKGRFQRLQEEPEYFSHYANREPKNSSQHFCTFIKIFCTFLFTFFLGILIGYISKKDSRASGCFVENGHVSTNETEILRDIIKNISKENIEKHYRYFTQRSVNNENFDTAKEIALLWTSMGLKDTQPVNYSALLDLPGSSPNTITMKNGQCYYPNGQQCDEQIKSHQSQEILLSYAAYSAKGTVEGEITDVQYGTVEDLQRVTQASNVTNNIALLKLGMLPLSYKLSILKDIGFRGALIYIDPCDFPKTSYLNDNLFMVSLKSRMGSYPFDATKKSGNSWTVNGDFTSMFVQPVTVSLLNKLFSIPQIAVPDKCTPFVLPEKEHGTVSLNIQSLPMYKNITNIIGLLRGALLPDRYIILGTPHSNIYGDNSQEWASGSAIMATIIESLMSKVKEGWRPIRTIVFCSWDGSTYGNTGSYKWAEEFRRILETNAVAYVGLHNPINGNISLHSIASPSLQQLISDSIKKVPNIFSEAVFIKKDSQQVIPFFYLHEYIAKLTLEMVLQITSEPLLPFNALDVALEIQKNIEGDVLSMKFLKEKARNLRETVQLFQSSEMRPANDPVERDPTRVRMLNDILQNMEKNFLIENPLPGFFRNILYRMDQKTTQFSTLEETENYTKLSKSNETLLEALGMVLNCINSAQLYFSESLYLFEDGSDRNA
uniref:N-acetylated alpha-linked acidic dipeptidase like 2 n=1 Tax=Leptobrachium leishanense TaxID=445787 RepID=A0A8C5QU21_9ANUR